jgi:hypothetical protein
LMRKSKSIAVSPANPRTVSGPDFGLDLATRNGSRFCDRRVSGHLYRWVSPPGRRAMFCVCFVCCLLATAWGCQGLASLLLRDPWLVRLPGPCRSHGSRGPDAALSRTSQGSAPAPPRTASTGDGFSFLGDLVGSPSPVANPSVASFVGCWCGLLVVCCLTMEQ